MTPADLDLLATLCRSRAGLRVDPRKTYLIDSRLGPLVRREGFNSPDALMTTLRQTREERLIWAVVEAMSLSETAFFRDRTPFQFFRDQMLPALVRLRGSQTVRIWSAGCSTGQEAYSLAMAADDSEHISAATQIDFYGSDLSERYLEKAQTGIYTAFEVQRGLPIRSLVKHFEKVEDNWRLLPRLRQKIRWRRVNLIGDLTPLGRFDVIFCRYVLSGMEEPYRKRVLENLAAVLPRDGFLILGNGESAEGITEAFVPIGGRPGLYARNPAFKVAA